MSNSIKVTVVSSTQYGTNDFLIKLSHQRVNGIFGKSGFPTHYYAWGEDMAIDSEHQLDLADYQIQYKYQIKTIKGEAKLCCFKGLVDLNMAPTINPHPEQSQDDLRTLPEFADYFAKLDGEEKTPF